MSIRRRLRKLESRLPPEPLDGREQEEQRRRIREEAQRSIERSLRDDREPAFEITEEGCVVSARDGKPIEDFHATLAEEWYWDYVEMGDPGCLIHDEGTEGFYMPNGELAFSRNRCYLPRFFWAIGDERADPWCMTAPERIEVGP
jgi:hypothetical protein